jgi:Sucrase/ferredoxin-like
MTSSPPDFRCSAASLLDEEPMAGTAPEESAWLLVEYAGPWGRAAVAESRLPESVREFLGGLADVRVQLIRRHGGESGPGVRVFAARLGGRPRVWTTVLDDVAELCDLRVDDPAAEPRFTTHDGPLWLVCTNGRRDLCCAETGRPIAAALSERWPEATWETTHLGGHRFSGTLLALPHGIALGRLDAGSAVDACASLEAGLLPAGSVRGRAGLPGAAQVAELHVRAELGLDRLGEVCAEPLGDGTVSVTAGGETRLLTVTASRGEPRRQSCADLKTKPGWVYGVVTWVPLST